MPVWCVFSCASVMCYQLGGGLLCSCGVFPAGRGSSVPVWCDSSLEGVVCASVEFLRVCDSSWEGVVCHCGVFLARSSRGSSVPVWCYSS